MNMSMKILKKAITVLLACASLAAHTQPDDKMPPLSMQEAIDMALQNNFNLRIARNNEDIARLENNWGNAGRLPVVNANAGYSYSSNNLRQKLVNGTIIERDGASFKMKTPM